MLKIYGNRMSNNTTRVEYTALATGITYEFKHMEFNEELKTPEFLKINPVGKIPAIDDDGFTLFESAAISKYICTKQNSDLYPTDPKARAIVEQWNDFVTLHVGDAMNKVAWNRAYAPKYGYPVNEQSIKNGVKFLERYLPILENQLTNNEFLAGDVMTLADITLTSFMDNAADAQIDISVYPHLSKWFNKMKEQDWHKRVKEA